MIVYKYKECGGNMMCMVLTCIPPIHKYTCNGCGRSVEDQEEITEVVK